jgi:hypothetical protein
MQVSGKNFPYRKEILGKISLYHKVILIEILCDLHHMGRPKFLCIALHIYLLRSVRDLNP